MNRLLFLLISLFVIQQSGLSQFQGQDVLRYDFSIWLNDSTDRIEGVARISMAISAPTKAVSLNLIHQQGGKGMKVSSFNINDKAANFHHAQEMLTAVIPQGAAEGDTLQLEISYSGIPADGLIISTNKHGNRTFFGDNWPNRAQNWIPVVDHPADKAYVTWRVYAPGHYQVIANGAEKERDYNADSSQVHYVYSSRVPLPTKVMVIGVADFAVEQAGISKSGKPVYSWVYPEEKEAGFHDYAVAIPVLDFMEEYIGQPYPYAKLANVQSKTMFGGMENASCIFYHENSIDGKRGETSLIAHEVAHQWFGNSATEADWPHLWLSEGFATYFTHLYREHSEGKAAMQEALLKDLNLIKFFAKANPGRPLVDTAERDLMKLLNPNSYQKGSWMLHMLRHRLGDKVFRASISNYYSRYALKNASSEDFIAVVEEVSGQNLDQFFEQWLHWPGIPKIEGSWEAKNGKLKLCFEQKQEQGLYELPLEIEVWEKDSKPMKVTVLLNKKKQTYTYALSGKDSTVEKVILDPDTWILMDGKLVRNTN
ncbi:MAG: M1 family metallopeptidase [Bacteroidia bacterium]